MFQNLKQMHVLHPSHLLDCKILARIFKELFPVICTSAAICFTLTKLGFTLAVLLGVLCGSNPSFWEMEQKG